MPAPSDKPENNRFGRKPSSGRGDRPRAGSFQQGEPRSERPQREDRPARFNREDRPFRNDRNDRPERNDRGDRNQRPERTDRSDRRPAFRQDDRPRRDFRDGAPAPFQQREPRRDFADKPRFQQRPAPAPQEQDEDWNEPQKAVGGIQEVEALLKSRPGIVHRVLFRKDSGNKKLYELQKLVKHLHIHHQQLEASLLDEQAPSNQGIVALCHEREVNSWETVRADLFAARTSGEAKTVAVIINMEDPRNLGACLRSCLALGVDTVLIPSKGMCGLTPLAARASAGAISQLTMCRPDNLEAALGELVAAGYDLVGLDSDTPYSLHDTPFSKHVVIAVGGEDRDLPPFIRKQCTKILRIPMMEAAHSYNASVALTLALYERARNAGFPGMLAPPKIEP